MEKIINLLGIIAIPIALFVLSPLWASRFVDTKELEYSVLDKRTMEDFVAGKDGWPEVKVLYNQQEVPRATFLTIGITNTGKLPIKADDFEGPLTILFNKPNSVIAERVVAKYPKDLPAELSIDGRGIHLKPLLLNPQDEVIIEVLGKDDFDLSFVSGRIVGVEPKKKNTEEKSGISVEDVRQSQINPTRTIQRSLYRIPKSVLAIVSILLLVLANVQLHLFLKLSAPIATKIIIVFSAIGSAILGAWTMALLVFSLKNAYQLAPWAQYILSVPIIGVSFSIALIIIRDIKLRGEAKG